MPRFNSVTLAWHLADVAVQAKAPRWFRIIYALIGLAGNLAGQRSGTEISRERANAAVSDWLTSSHPITRN